MASVDNAVHRIEEGHGLRQPVQFGPGEIVATVGGHSRPGQCTIAGQRGAVRRQPEISQTILRVNDMGRQIAEAMGGASRHLDLAVRPRSSPTQFQDMKRG